MDREFPEDENSNDAEGTHERTTMDSCCKVLKRNILPDGTILNEKAVQEAGRTVEPLRTLQTFVHAATVREIKKWRQRETSKSASAIAACLLHRQLD